MSTKNSRKKVTRARVKTNRVKLLPLILAYQMFLPAHAFAEAESEPQRERQAFSKTAGVLGFLNEAGQGYIQAHQARMQQQQSMMRAQQMRQALGVKPVDPSQVPPIISQNGCMVLQARTEQVSNDMSCKGPFDYNAFMSGQYDALFSVAESNVNDLQNFLVSGHERDTTQGVGCYDKARKNLSQQLNGRLEMLEQMKESIEARVQAFKKLSENDVRDIKKGDALLNGSNAGDKETQAAMKDFKWEDKFNDPQCKSLAQAQFNQTGSAGGFRGIEAALDKNKESMNAESFFTKKNQFEKEIRNIAKEAAKQARREDAIPDAAKALSGIRTREVPTSSPALVQSFNIIAKRASNKRQDMQKDLNKVLGGEEELIGLSKTVASDSVDIDAAIHEWEKDQKNACINSYFKREFDSIEGFVSKIKDPNISDKANKEADNSFKNYLRDTLARNDLTVEKKMELIAKEQNSSNNSRFGMMSGRSFKVDGKQVGASTRLLPQQMVSIFGQECIAAFNQDPRKGGSSAGEMVKALKNYAVEHKRAKAEFANNLETEIINGMINCPDQQAVGSAVNSCGPDQVNINKPGFCVRTANSCAANAMSCLDKAKKIVETTKKEQQAIAKRYKANMDKLKADLIAEFKSVKASFEASSRQIDGLFKFGTTFNKDEKPLDSSLELNFTTKELEAGIDPSLAIEDPEKYKAKIVKNIDSLKRQVAGHNQQILQGYDDEVNKYKQNYEKQLNDWSGIAQQCAEKIGRDYAMFLEDHNRNETEQANQYNEQLMETCNKYLDFRENPCPSGGGSAFGDLGGDIAAIATTVEDQESAREIRRTIASCDAFGNEGGFNSFDPTSSQSGGGSSKDQMSFAKFCEKYSEAPGCAKVNLLKDDYALSLKNIANDSGGCRESDLIDGYAKMRTSKKVICKIQDEEEEQYKERGINDCDGEVITDLEDLPANHEIKKALYVYAKCDSKSSPGRELRKEYEEAEKEARVYYSQYQQQQFNKQVGQIQVAACEGGHNGDPSMPSFDGYEGGRNLANQLFGSGAYQD